MIDKKRSVKKPWGGELIWAETENYIGKILFIKKEHRLSKQYHSKKEETIFINSGILSLEIEKDEKSEKIVLNAGQTFHIEPGLVHRFCAEFGDVEVIEVSTPHLEDVIRIEDDYKRK